MDRCKEVVTMSPYFHNRVVSFLQEVKSADTIVASYGSFIALQENSGVCQYLHINLCKSAKLRVHLIEHHASLGSRQRPSIRTVLATIPAMESFTTVLVSYYLCFTRYQLFLRIPLDQSEVFSIALYKS